MFAREVSRLKFFSSNNRIGITVPINSRVRNFPISLLVSSILDENPVLLVEEILTRDRGCSPFSLQIFRASSVSLTRTNVKLPSIISDTVQLSRLPREQRGVRRLWTRVYKSGIIQSRGKQREKSNRIISRKSAARLAPRK